MKLIIHTGTGTIIDASECVILDLDALGTNVLTEDAARDLVGAYEAAIDGEADDTDVIALATRYGVPVA